MWPANTWHKLLVNILKHYWRHHIYVWLGQSVELVACYCHSNSLLFSFRNARIWRDISVRFPGPAVIRPQRESELSPRIPVMLALTEGRVLVGQWVCKWPFTQTRTQFHYHCPSLSQSSQICSGSAGVSDHGQCSSRCCCLQLVCQETVNFFARAALPLLSIVACCFYSSRCRRTVTHTVA